MGMNHVCAIVSLALAVSASAGPFAPLRSPVDTNDAAWGRSGTSDRERQ